MRKYGKENTVTVAALFSLVEQYMRLLSNLKSQTGALSMSFLSSALFNLALPILLLPFIHSALLINFSEFTVGVSGVRGAL